MYENVSYDTDMIDSNILSIVPSEIKDNSIYRIKISGIKTKDNKKIFPETTFNILTAVSPMYCTLKSLKALINKFNISDKDLLIYIKDASNYADFIGGSVVSSSDDVDFAKEQFTKTKVTLDCLLRGIVDKSYENGSKYTLDVATYEESSNLDALQKLIDDLKDELIKWQDAIRGYYNEGRAAPVVTRIGIKSNTNSDVSHTTVDTILNDFTRTPPEGSN